MSYVQSQKPPSAAMDELAVRATATRVPHSARVLDLSHLGRSVESQRNSFDFLADLLRKRGPDFEVYPGSAIALATLEFAGCDG